MIATSWRAYATTAPSHLQLGMALRTSAVVGKRLGVEVKSGRALMRRELQRGIRSMSEKSVESQDRAKNAPYFIAITGGPCAGKSSALVKLSSILPRFGGVNVMTAPEFSTLFFTGGCAYPAAGSREERVAWDLNKLKAQMAYEDALRAVVESRSEHEGPTVILVDRGVMDTKAFISEESWEYMLRVHGWDEEQFLRRYDSVIHLVTTAIGAEEHYSSVNNAARRETLEQARDQDSRVRDAWVQHPNFRIISNRCVDFDAKLRKVTDAVCDVAGLPTPVSEKQKWLVQTEDSFKRGGDNILSDAVKIENLVEHHVETNFISGDNRDEDICVRRSRRLVARGGGHGSNPPISHHWIYSVHERHSGSTRARPLSRRDYFMLRSRGGVSEETISMKRTSFVWEESFWKLDEFYGAGSLSPKVSVLTLEAGSSMDGSRLPPFFTVIQEMDGSLSLREMRQQGILQSDI